MLFLGYPSTSIHYTPSGLPLLEQREEPCQVVQRLEDLAGGQEGQLHPHHQEQTTATQRIVRLLRERVPVAILTDCDTGGMGIDNVSRFGSHQSVVYRNKLLACPRAIHIGLIPEDRTKYTLTGQPEELTWQDRSTLLRMFTRPFIQAHSIAAHIQSVLSFGTLQSLTAFPLNVDNLVKMGRKR